MPSGPYGYFETLYLFVLDGKIVAIKAKYKPLDKYEDNNDICRFRMIDGFEVSSNNEENMKKVKNLFEEFALRQNIGAAVGEVVEIIRNIAMASMMLPEVRDFYLQLNVEFNPKCE
jgi:hypothetical protein